MAAVLAAIILPFHYGRTKGMSTRTKSARRGQGRAGAVIGDSKRIGGASGRLGPARLVMTALRRLGCTVHEYRAFEPDGSALSILVIS